MTENTKNIKTNILTIIIAAALGLLLTIIELAAKKYGLELRTYMQVIKGCYLWLVMPCVILFSGNSLLKQIQEKELQNAEQIKAGRVLNGLRNIAVAIFLLVIAYIAATRGLLYIFTEEMVTEEVTQDGYIRGVYAGFFSGSHYRYYVPIGGIFRKQFSGWPPEQLNTKVKEECSPDAELVEKQGDGWYLFRVPDTLAEGEYIYFHVSDSFTIPNNYPLQLLLSEASHFWSTRNRYVTFSCDNDLLELKDAIDTGKPLNIPLSTYGTLHITCYDSEDDIAACAADITDWLQFVKTTGQFPYDTDFYTARLLAHIQIGNGNSSISLNLYPLSNFMDDSSWETRYQRTKAALAEAYEEYNEWVQEQNNANVLNTDVYTTDADTDADALFMATYDDNYYEKECVIGDGAVRYRMVVRDAALGHRLYSLLKSTDSGKTWQMSSSLPFGYEMGMGIDFTFLDENFGFATLAHNGGDEAVLYVTENGGDTYQLVVMEGYTVTLDDGYTYNPYDYPQMPYEENGTLYVLCGQGEDGDYAGGDDAGLALYQSADGGHIFTFVEIQPPAGKH